MTGQCGPFGSTSTGPHHCPGRQATPYPGLFLFVQSFPMNEIPTPLLETVLASPGDDVSRLILADWLEERGDTRASRLRASGTWVLAPLNSERWDHSILTWVTTGEPVALGVVKSWPRIGCGTTAASGELIPGCKDCVGILWLAGAWRCLGTFCLSTVIGQARAKSFGQLFPELTKWCPICGDWVEELVGRGCCLRCDDNDHATYDG